MIDAYASSLFHAAPAHARPEGNRHAPPQAQAESADIYLDGTGLIRRCSSAVEALFGYSSADVMWQPISKLLPDFSRISLFKDGQLNPMVNYLCRCGHLFRAQGKSGASFDSELFFISLPGREDTVRLIVKPCC